MADIQTTTTGKRKGVKRLIKKSTRVDLTPMVDLGFLLITFFVFTCAMTKPKVMDLVTPLDTNDITHIKVSSVLTVMLEKNNTIAYYEGMAEDKPVIKHTSFSVEGIRSVLLDKKAAVKKILGDAREMVLIIKPTDESSYKEFVDILDEVAINGITHYFISEMNDADKKMLATAE